MRDLVDISKFDNYEVHLEFTDLQDPTQLCGAGLPYVSVKNEIVANTNSHSVLELRGKNGSVPYGSPVYIWESHTREGVTIEYIGQTMSLNLQSRFERHGKLIQILSKHVNNSDVRVFYRLCSRLDIVFGGNVLRAIEHFPFEQACVIVADIEAFLINKMKPNFNLRYKHNEKKYRIPFTITQTKNINIPIS